MGKVTKDVGAVVGIPASIQAVQERARAEWRIEYYSKHYDLSTEQVVGLSKWLTASLFAANSAGLLTVLNKADEIALSTQSGLCFVLGLVFALLSATANQYFYNKMASPLLDLIAYWQEVKITGIRIDEDRVPHETSLNAAMKWTWIGEAIGWLSGIAFVVGAAIIPFGFG